MASRGVYVDICFFAALLNIIRLTEGAEKWAVIVAGSNGYSNYRHQADACHAVQIVKAKGIPEDNIITMMYDDIADNQENPFPGKLFNRPDPNGPGIDVYSGCHIDYKKSSVTPQTFMDVLSGKGDGKVLKSKADDHVFVYFADHGAPGLIAFPDEVLHKTNLQDTLKTMHTKSMFKQLVFYLEACESGSMFEGMDIPGVYAISAANARESSWGTYCGSDARVNGKDLNSCLGDLFSVSWMEDSDSHDATKETLQEQFERVRTLTDKSHVLQFGDKSFVDETVGNFIGSTKSAFPLDVTVRPAAANKQRARDIHIHRLLHMYTSAEGSAARLSGASRLQSELAQQEQVDWVFQHFVALIYPGDMTKQAVLKQAKSKPDHPDCELRAHEALSKACAHRFKASSSFALGFHQIIVNACDIAVKEVNVDIPSMAKLACAEAGYVTSDSEADSELVV
eukprot:TRINITY_DN486_c0_g1_i12.p1 TRINITY_DN486_c0_g1~~TRINITY_DN486_c0_g1_i12.p1  ORF type:complete len:470 (+),score=79.55 TRINITY_DN486_c0_g1_i12:54-1412(+)